MKGCLLLVLLLLSLPSFSQDAEPQEELTSLSSSIASNLQSLRLESEAMVEQLSRLSQTLQQSESERKELEIQSSRLSSSLTAINAQLNDSYRTIAAYEEKLRMQRMTLTIMLLVLGLRLVGIVAGYILYANGIKLPRWLDILL